MGTEKKEKIKSPSHTTNDQRKEMEPDFGPEMSWLRSRGRT